MHITPREDGRFEVGDRIFESKEAAELFASSRSAKTRSTPVEGIEAPDWKKGASYLILGALMLYGLSSCLKAGNKPAAPLGTSESGARTMCRQALKMASKDPDTAEVPYVDDMGKGGEYFFAWGASTKPVRMKNGFGALLAAGASCTVDKKTGRITSLTLDGKSVM